MQINCFSPQLVYSTLKKWFHAFVVSGKISLSWCPKLVCLVVRNCTPPLCRNNASSMSMDSVTYKEEKESEVLADSW